MLLQEDFDFLRELSDRMEAFGGPHDPGDWLKLRELADRVEYEQLVADHYPNSVTPAIATQMRELERRLCIETLVPRLEIRREAGDSE